ncbi:MAG: HAD family hydrolase, partial [Thaumarchaeota archaeon]|nr:HAD family hydrolase [Nitrososphaerota archaeon]
MKGAPESVLEKCTSSLQEGGLTPLNSEGRERIHRAAESMAGKALRVLAVAKREITNGQAREEDSLEREFVFLGLVGMIDPPRPEAIEAIRTAKKVGMRPIMITGDHRITALAIASQMGIYQNGDLALTGEELQRTRDDEYEKIVELVTVYA